jgi:hypothetical protein
VVELARRQLAEQLVVAVDHHQELHRCSPGRTGQQPIVTVLGEGRETAGPTLPPHACRHERYTAPLPQENPMAERRFDQFHVRTGASREGSRYTAWLAVTPLAGGFPVYYAICENRSFRDQDAAEAAAAKALAELPGLEEDGTPAFPDDYTGFDDAPADEA